MKGNYNASIKIANEKYGYKNPENPGNLPKGTIINGVKYILIPITHTAVCDSKGCQNQFVKFCKEKPDNKKYTIFPLYSNFGTHELCIICSNIENNTQFITSRDENNLMLAIMNRYDLMDDEGDTLYQELENEIDELKI